MSELHELQTLIEGVRRQRGFTTDPIRIFTLLNEEIGEVAAELKKTWSPNYPDLELSRLGEELADVFVLLSALATNFDIDLETAVRRKFVDADSKRTWATQIDEDG